MEGEGLRSRSQKRLGRSERSGAGISSLLLAAAATRSAATPGRGVCMLHVQRIYTANSGCFPSGWQKPAYDAANNVEVGPFRQPADGLAAKDWKYR